MAVGIGAEGFIGIAFETTVGTYVAPTQFFPIKSESLAYTQETQIRRLIRGIADPMGGVAGFSHIEGDIEMELMESALPYFLQVTRNSVVKTGAGPNYTYTSTPTHTALGPTPKPSMSITVVRSGVVFGYLGCFVGQMEFSVDSGIPSMKFSIVGLDEATQAGPTFTADVNDIPFGAGQFSIEIPTASQVFDCETYTYTVNDNAAPVHRLHNSTKARYIQFGEREVSAKVTRDFDGRVEYDAYKALTAQSLNLKHTRSANNSVELKMPATAIRESYDLGGLADQGSLIQAEVTYQAQYDSATSKAYEIIVKCQENIV